MGKRDLCILEEQRSLLADARRALATNFTFKSAYLARSHYLSAIKNLEGRRRSATPTCTFSCPTTVCSAPPHTPLSATSAYMHRAAMGKRGSRTVRVVSHRALLGFITDNAAADSWLPTERSPLLSLCVRAISSRFLLPRLFPLRLELGVCAALLFVSPDFSLGITLFFSTLSRSFNVKKHRDFIIPFN